MELSEDRGLECQGVCFDLTDGKIVLSVYKNLPGIKRNLAGTSFLRTFTIDDWKAINGYLMDCVGDEKEEVVIHSERRDLSVSKGIEEEKDSIELQSPRISEEEEEEVVQFRPIGVPSMTT